MTETLTPLPDTEQPFPDPPANGFAETPAELYAESDRYAAAAGNYGEEARQALEAGDDVAHTVTQAQANLAQVRANKANSDGIDAHEDKVLAVMGADGIAPTVDSSAGVARKPHLFSGAPLNETASPAPIARHRVRPKAEEVRQAQVAAYASEALPNRQDREHLLNNIGKTAVGDVETVTRTTQSAELRKDNTGNKVRISKGTEVTVATPEDYQQFLRKVGGSQYEGIQARAEMLQAYAKFAPAVGQLKTELAALASPEQHSAFLGEGSKSQGFVLHIDGKEYVARILKGRVAPSLVDEYVAGGVLSKGAAHLEQMAAASYVDGVTISERIPGKEVGDMTATEINGVSEERLAGLVDTLVDARRRGIEIDLKSSNVLYDREQGYGIIDVDSSKVASKTSPDQRLGNLLDEVSVVIHNTGFYGKPSIPLGEKTAGDYAHDLEIHKADLGLLKRYRNVISQKLAGDERQVVMDKLDVDVRSLQETVENYSNSEWVADDIAADAIRKRQRDELKKNATENPTTTNNSGRSVASDVL